MKDLELTSPQSAHVEKELAGIVKDVRVCIQGVRKAGAEMYGYTFIKGMRLLRAKELVPHGNFMPWVESQFPDETHRSCTNAMNLAVAIKAKLETVSNLKTKQLLLGKAKITKKDHEPILSIVPELMDGMSIKEFMRDAKLLREPKHQTHHKPKELSPEELLDAQREQDIALVNALIGDINQLTEDEDLKTLTNIPPKLREQLEEARITLGHKINQLKKAAKK